MSAPFAWFDVTAKNAGEVREFYASLLGWAMQAAPQPYEGWMADGGQPWGGVMASDTATAAAAAGCRMSSSRILMRPRSGPWP